MAGVMMAMNRYLPGGSKISRKRWGALPPKRITRRLAERARLQSMMKPGEQWDAPTWLGHLGYGAATASVYGFAAQFLRFPRILSGMLFAFLVWTGSYIGWLPAFNILPPATKEPARRNAVMISAHLVWGALIGLLVGWAIKPFRGEK
jgi:putative membrane protein